MVENGSYKWIKKFVNNLIQEYSKKIEAAIRNLAEAIGLLCSKPFRLGGFNYSILNEFLNDNHIIKVFGEDFSIYLRVLFTEPRVWKLRNNVCHGMRHIETINQIITDRVMHTLLCLTLVKNKQDAS